MTTDERILLEEQILHLLLTNREACAEFCMLPFREKLFDTRHRMLLQGIIESQENKVTLTLFSYLGFVERNGVPKKEIIAEETLFNRVRTVSKIKRDDLPMLLERLREAYLSRVGLELIEEYSRNIKATNAVHAANELSSKMRAAVDDMDTTENVKFEVVGSEEFKEQYHKVFESRFNPDTFIECGIHEIDYIMGRGFAAGDLTVICADVGSFKSTLMLNVALGVYEKAKVDVLFVPLEMPRNAVFDKMLSRASKVPFKLIQKPVDPKTGARLLTDADKAKVISAVDTWTSPNCGFAFLEMGDRTTVKAIRRQIEKHIAHHRPRLVVIDYVANLLPDQQRKDGNHLEIGDMLKAMIAMSKPGCLTPEGFAVLTAAQLNRSALTRVRNQREQTKQVLASEDIMGSHHYSMDAANIFGLLNDPAFPKQKIQVFPMKSRYGETSYEDGSNKGILRVQPAISLITSDKDQSWDSSAQQELLTIWQNEVPKAPEEESSALSPLSMSVRSANEEGVVSLSNMKVGDLDPWESA